MIILKAININAILKNRWKEFLDKGIVWDTERKER